MFLQGVLVIIVTVLLIEQLLQNSNSSDARTDANNIVVLNYSRKKLNLASISVFQHVSPTDLSDHDRRTY